METDPQNGQAYFSVPGLFFDFYFPILDPATKIHAIRVSPEGAASLPVPINVPFARNTTVEVVVTLPDEPAPGPSTKPTIEIRTTLWFRIS